MKKIIKLSLFAILLMAFSFLALPVRAQSSTDDLSPKTQQYIDNVNELKEVQKTDNSNSLPQTDDKGTSPWTYVFYGFLSGAAYAFWRWVKKLKNG